MPICRFEIAPMILRLTAALLALSSPALAEGWPRTLTHAGSELTLESPPKRIVSTAPSLTGILLAIDAPVTATAAALVGPLTDDQGFFRQWADVAQERGVEVLYPNLQFDIEALILSEPDLVVASATGGDSILPYVPQLQAQGIPVLVINYATAGWEEQAEELGRATGHEEDAARVRADFLAHAQDARTQMRRPEGTASIVSYNMAATYAVSKSSSAQAKVLAELGFDIAGLPQDMASLVKRSGDFDFLSHENLPAAITGDSVFLLNGTPEMVAAFKADPVLANLPAVRSDQVYPLGPTSFRVDYYSGLAIIDTLKPYFTP